MRISSADSLPRRRSSLNIAFSRSVRFSNIALHFSLEVPNWQGGNCGSLRIVVIFRTENPKNWCNLVFLGKFIPFGQTARNNFTPYRIPVILSSLTRLSSPKPIRSSFVSAVSVFRAWFTSLINISLASQLFVPLFITSSCEAGSAGLAWVCRLVWSSPVC